MNRKLKKLIKTPRLYFVDMFKKKQAKGELPKMFSSMMAVKGNHKFSVVSAVYGVEHYLEEYFKSIENQTLNFIDHIELIMVDDGSLDGSANIIKKWAEKYPDNIKYVKKGNGGQASARNVGMHYVSHDWVTFIDPDDFVDANYFAEVDRTISTNVGLSLICCNLVFYIEDTDQFSDNHPLNFKFKEKCSIHNVTDLGHNVQLSASTAFFRSSLVYKGGLEFDPTVKPTFEDAHFIGKYLLANSEERVCFIKDAKYFYRKRDDNSSTIDNSWQSVDQYSVKLENGYLDLLERAKNENGVVPVYIQNIILYDLMWYIKYIVNNKERLSFLDEKQQQSFMLLLRRIFTYIDSDVIDRFNRAGCWYYHKVGMLGCFKDEDIKFQIVYVESYDAKKKLVELRYFYTGSPNIELLLLDGEETIPVYAKTRVHNFLDDVFINERILWVQLDGFTKSFSAELRGLDTRLSLAGKHHHDGVETNRLVNHFKKKNINDNKFPRSIKQLRNKAQSLANAKVYNKAWLLMDRDVQADDNAEHLYRYLMNKHEDTNIFFVLRKTSHDWERLEKEGFKLLDFDSGEHKIALLNADHVISSHADNYVVSLLDKKWFSDLLTFKYTFLQHGITKDDISNWLNNKSIDLFVTATPQEYNSIAGQVNRYKYSNKEVSLTGFARHDALLKLNESVETEKLILIMPTWRQGIVGPTLGKGNDREVSDDFYVSEYAQAWKSFLHSDKLKQLRDSHGYEVAFFPHANIQPYIDWFETPEYINTLSHNNIVSIQDLFCRSSLMITDYSSVAFEMAYLKKAIIYYQFDFDFVFGGGHLTNKGYFDYVDDGFGPVCLDEAELLDALDKTLSENSGLNEIYSDRIDETFVRRDGLCCQRIYEEIIKRDSPEIAINSKESTVLKDYAEIAMSKANWPIAIQRWQHVYNDDSLSSDQHSEACRSVISCAKKDGKLGEAKKWIGLLSDQTNINGVQLEKAKLILSYYQWEQTYRLVNDAYSMIEKSNWDGAFECWNKVTPELSFQIYIDSIFYKVEALVNLRKWKDAKEALSQLDDCKLSEEDQVTFEGWLCVVERSWDDALCAWEKLEVSGESLSSNRFKKLQKYKLLNHLEEGDYSNYLHIILKTRKFYESDFDDVLRKINDSVEDLDFDLNSLSLLGTELSKDDFQSLNLALSYYKFFEEVVRTTEKVIAHD